jgi:hypothetical protein
MIEVCAEQGKITTETTKKLIVSINLLRMVEAQIFAAFVAPKDDVFWQSENSEIGKMLKSITTVIPLRNEN